jgi:hypothetical protein
VSRRIGGSWRADGAGSIGPKPFWLLLTSSAVRQYSAAHGHKRCWRPASLGTEHLGGRPERRCLQCSIAGRGRCKALRIGSRPISSRYLRLSPAWVNVESCSGDAPELKSRSSLASRASTVPLEVRVPARSKVARSQACKGRLRLPFITSKGSALRSQSRMRNRGVSGMLPRPVRRQGDEGSASNPA